MSPTDILHDYERDGVVLLQPLARQGRPWGALLLGPKQTGQRYVEEDLTFLSGLAAEAAQALERLHLVRTLAAESSARAARWVRPNAVAGTRRTSTPSMPAISSTGDAPASGK